MSFDCSSDPLQCIIIIIIIIGTATFGKQNMIENKVNLEVRICFSPSRSCRTYTWADLATALRISFGNNCITKYTDSFPSNIDLRPLIATHPSLSPKLFSWGRKSFWLALVLYTKVLHAISWWKKMSWFNQGTFFFIRRIHPLCNYII